MDGAGDLLRSALIPLATPPDAPAWNHAEMADLLGGTQRRKASVLLALRDDAQQRLIFTVRTNTLQQHAGQVAFPGGRMEPDDADTIATALRESEEEIGLASAAVTPLGFLDRFDTISGYCITPVVATIDAHARLRADPGEVEEIFEVPFAFFLEPANLRRYTMEYRGHQRDMVEFLHAGHRIWGATASILLNLLRRMGRA
jgi:8-oxo-dGTP pyrophosphatase MutT (NUDIX family)